MRRTVLAGFLSGFAFLALTGTAFAQLTEQQVPGLRLVFVDGPESFLVPHATRTALNSLRSQKKIFGFEPWKKPTVLVVDLQDKGNAGASTVPNDLVTVYIAPIAFIYETIATNERLNTLLNHEFVHIATMDEPNGRDRIFRRLFGGKVIPVSEQPESVLFLYLTSPRVAAPRWYHEGIAVFMDTWMAGGLGRAQSGYDEMVWRSMVKDDTPFYDPLGLVSEGTKIDFQQETNSYLYGTRFMVWLARHYTPEQLIEWTSRRDGSRAYYSAQFRKVFGVSLNDAWASWVKDEHAFQQANLAEIRKYPITRAKDITNRPLGSVSRAYFDPATRKIFAAFNYPGVVGHIGSIDIDTGAVHRIVPIKGPAIHTVASVAWDPDDRTIFYTTDNNAWRDLVRLDPATGKTKLLMKDARIGDLAFNRTDKTILGIRHMNGICTLVRIKAPYTAWEQVTPWPYGTTPYDLDVSPAGDRIVASFGNIEGKQEVQLLDLAGLANGDATPVARFDFGQSVPNNFTFSPDGKYLFGSSYYTGVSNIFRYEIATKAVEAVSNTDSGFMRPIPLGDDRLVVFRYTGRGFIPATIDATVLKDIAPITFLGERLSEERPIVKTWNVGSPLAIPYDEMKKDVEPYKLLREIRTESFYPMLQGYKDSIAIGGRVNFSDPLRMNHAMFSASFSPDSDLPANERVHLKGEYQRYDWRGFGEWNNADFYDMFGPTKVGRKEYTRARPHEHADFFDEPRRLELDLDGSFSGNLDRLPQVPERRSRREAPDDRRRQARLQRRAQLARQRGRRDRDAVDAGGRAERRGQQCHRDGARRLRSGFRAAGRPLVDLVPRVAGFSPNDRAEPFANFYFGGFGNNYIDHLDEKRYREYYDFPASIEIGGRNYVKSTAEVNLPPWRFRRVGTAGFYATWMRPALFVTGLATNLDAPSTDRHVAVDAGGQLDFRVTMLSVLDLTFSVGGAIAFEDGQLPRREAMFSLKLLR